MYPEDDYPVGYGRPPKNTQFRKGFSGNPKGRPRGTKNIATMFWKIVRERVKINGPKGPKYITKLEAGITQMVKRAAQGDPKAIKEVIQLSTSFADAVPLPPPPPINIVFVKAKDGKRAEEAEYGSD
jgi:hypothetical protein